METGYIRARVIRTSTQSFIEDNKETLCELLFGVHILNNKSIKLSFPESGGFHFVNDELNLFAGSAFRDENEAAAWLTKHFSEMNKRIADVFLSSGEVEDFTFFPLKFMKKITAYPVYEQQGSYGRALRFYNVRYKIEIPSFENASRKQEYANMLNGGIEASISPDQRIAGMKYNLLPFESEYFARINEPKEGIAQLAYLGNRETRSVAPFFLSNLEKAYVPASRESFFPFPANKKLPTDWDENRVVVWLRKQPAGDQTKDGKQKIPLPGTKLIRLKPETDSSEKVKCLYWWNGEYYTDVFNESFLGDDNNMVTEFSGRVLQNDIAHLLSRNIDYLGIQKEFDSVFERIKSFNKQELKKDEVQAGITTVKINLGINLSDKPATLKKLQEALYRVYDPIRDTTLPQEKFSTETLIVPLSREWFSVEISLDKKYTEVWQDAESKYQWRQDDLFTGASGTGFEYSKGNFQNEKRRANNEDAKKNVKDILNELLFLKQEIKEKRYSETVLKTPEAKWLLQLDDDLANKIVRVIFISDATWRVNEEFHELSYTDSGVALEYSFGPIRVPPLLIVLIHELVVNSSKIFIPPFRDTHLDKYMTFKQWDDANQGKIDEIKKTQDAVDELYQSRGRIAAVVLGIIVNIITGQ